MRTPKLIHPCLFQIYPQSFIDTKFDSSLKEPVGEKKYAQPIEIMGQINYNEYYSYGRGQKVTHAGLKEENTAFIMFKYIDAETKNWNPRHGDMIKTFYYKSSRAIEMNVYVTHIRPAAHINGIPHLFRAYYQDKHPSIQGSQFNIRFES